MAFICSSLKRLESEEITLFLQSVYYGHKGVKPRAECAGVDKSQALHTKLQTAQGHHKYHWKWQLFGISVPYTEAMHFLSLTLPVKS